MRTLLLTGTAAEAAVLARMLQLDRNEWDYLHSAERMLGLRGTPIVAWGTWRRRPHEELDRILETARTREMPVLQIERIQ